MAKAKQIPLIDTPKREPGFLYRLDAENVMRLELVSLTFDAPGLTVIEGENANGKTAVLNTIAMLLGGKIVADPVRHGAEKGTAAADFGDRVVTLKVTPDREADREMIGKDGRPFPRGVTELAKKLGPSGLDPLRYLDEDEDKQLAIVTEICPALNMSDLDAESDRIYRERTDVNRDAKNLRAQSDGVTVPPPVEVGEERAIVDVVDVAEIAAKKADVERTKAANQRERLRLEKIQDATFAAGEALQEAEREVHRLREALRQAEADEAAARKAHAAAQEAAIEAGKALVALVDPDTTQIDAEIAEGKRKNAAARAEVEAHNRAVRERQRQADDRRRALADRERLVKQAEAKEAESKRMTARLDEIEAERHARLASAKLPVPGLSVAKGRLMLDTGRGPVPLNGGASDAERFDAAARIVGARCDALGLPLRLLLIDRGESLDVAHLRGIEQWARENNYQVVLTRALIGQPPSGIVLRDGKVAGDHRPQLEAFE